MDLGAGFLDTPASVSRESTETEIGTTTAAAPVEYATLDEEIGNVMSSLGSFWGKVRKQSVVALAQANSQLDKASRDLTPLVDKARSNLVSFSELTKAELERLSEISNSSGSSVMIGADGTPIISEGITRAEKGKGREEESHGMESASAFFSKLQTQMNPSFQELSKNFNLIQSNLSENLSTMKLDSKEDFRVKGEYIITKLSKLANNAVNIIPPTTKLPKTHSNRIQFQKSQFLQNLTQSLQIDPAQPPQPNSIDTRQAFSAFLATIEQKGGMESAQFENLIQNELTISAKDEIDHVAISLAELSKLGISREAFWSRYFFKMHQLEEEEARRREVLSAATTPGVDETDFSWDMEDEEEPTSSLPLTPSTPTTKTTPPVTTTPKPLKTPLETPLESNESSPVHSESSPKLVGPTSPRASSDGTGSYDVVGEASGNPSEAENVKASDGEDSDWE